MRTAEFEKTMKTMTLESKKGGLEKDEARFKNESENLQVNEEESSMQVMKKEKSKKAPLRFNPNIDLKTLTMSELYDKTFSPMISIIDGILYSGTYLFAGPPKTGKSFFVCQIAYHVAMGLPLWNHSVRKGKVLYLALEDGFNRLQTRLNHMFGEESTSNLVLTIQSKTLKDGLVEQMERFVQRNDDTRLIIIDTLQKVRSDGSKAYSYSSDYENITKLKSFADSHNLCLLIVHHTRKGKANDSFDTISGTNGLLGAADGAIVLKKDKLVDNTAKMTIVGRDQESQNLILEFNREHCIWELTEAENENEARKKVYDPIVSAVVEFMKERKEWTGSATDLLELLPELKIKPHVLTRRLNANVSALYNDFDIGYKQNDRSREKRTFTLRKVSIDEGKDDVQSNVISVA